MSNLTADLIIVSAVSVGLASIASFRRTRRALLAIGEVGGVAATVAIIDYVFDLRRPVVVFGSVETLTVVIAYISVLLGMVAEYLFQWSDRSSERRQIDWLALVRPVFISPLIFLPVFATMSIGEGDLLNTRNALTWLVAFQNGFFWSVVYGRANRRH